MIAAITSRFEPAESEWLTSSVVPVTMLSLSFT
jgi:hypothetical protein